MPFKIISFVFSSVFIDSNLLLFSNHIKYYLRLKKGIPKTDIPPTKLGGGGFEPPKHDAADLQSVPFGHSGIHPYARAYLP